MIYHFDTNRKPAATAALLVYVVYRSRDRQRFKITPELWEKVARFVKDSAKRAKSLPEFLDALAPRLCCGALNPRWMDVGEAGLTPITMGSGSTGYIEPGEGHRDFMVRIVEGADAEAALKCLLTETIWIIAMVRDRLENEKTFDQQLSAYANAIDHEPAIEGEAL